MRTVLTPLAFSILCAVGASTAHAHYLTVETGYYCRTESDCTPWELVTATAEIRRADIGKTGAIFIAAAANSGGEMMTFTSRGWVAFRGGMEEPAMLVNGLRSNHSIVVYDSRPRDGLFRFTRTHAGPNLYGLTGPTICDAARTLGANRFSIAVGYGALTPDAEATVARNASLGGQLDSDWIRMAYIYGDMMKLDKWSTVRTFDCINPYGGGGN